ncbi:hypothetical protein K788_0006482 [Paraburkholderia caribensis MBA4]|uniref:Uncharacterized protein n=1 Tax=Paraburkholderia caribensis MBA4 TaxID=1323664 RepID=A0A0P0RBY5_9BURK|nr:hypothetical protein K788_0006482 [Paraburkholderia caribensis MBA4]
MAALRARPRKKSPRDGYRHAGFFIAVAFRPAVDQANIKTSRSTSCRAGWGL